MKCLFCNSNLKNNRCYICNITYNVNTYNNISELTNYTFFIRENNSLYDFYFNLKTNNLTIYVDIYNNRLDRYLEEYFFERKFNNIIPPDKLRKIYKELIVFQ